LKKNSAAFLNLCFKIKLLSKGVLFALALTLFAPDVLGANPISLPKKSVPAFTFRDLSPPYKNYDYFQNSRWIPFEYGASSFSLVNAWWLAEASTLVYAVEDYVRPRLIKAGLNRVVFFNQSSTQCFIASNSRFAIVVFRGSEIWKRNERFDPHQMIADFKTNIDIRLSDWIQGGKVHSGFRTALDSVWDDMLPEIKHLRDQRIPIWMTGHSLGAALATLAADRLPNVQGLYTFGSPRVGDQEFQKMFGLKAFRVVNSKDIVANIPPKDPYRHVGEYIFIDQKGDIHALHRTKKDPDVVSRDTDSNASGNVGEVRKSDSALYIPDSIRDHVPLLYSIYIWNKLVESLPGYEISKMTQTAAATTEAAASGPEADASAGRPVDSNNPLSGTEWRFVEFQSMDDTIGTVKPKDPSLFTMRLNNDGTVTMRLDCNSASGTWISEPSDDGSSGRFEFGVLAATHAMCPPPNLDEHILAQARYIRGYLLREGKLYLSLLADGGIYAWEPDTDYPFAASIPAAPEDGGPRNWQVTGVSRVLNLREQPTITARIVARYAPGTILDNLGCQRAEGRIWCDVQQLGGGPRGYVAAEFLKPAVSPDGSVAMGPDNSAFRAGQGNFDAMGQIACAQYPGQPMTQCDFGVARAGGGYATVVITKPDGRSRAIFFRMGKPIGADTSETDGYPEFRATKRNDLHLIRIGGERYEIPDAVVLSD
jgi:hypothetical protein